MKSTIRTLIILGLCFMMTLSVAYGADATGSIYGDYDSFDELYDAYMEAVESGDDELQKELLEIGRTSLEAEIEASESDVAVIQVDPDEAYWRQKFPKYFNYGYFESRSSGWTLSLGPKLTSWSSTDKANGWKSVFAKFHNNSH